jgi:predicted phosphoribosyltransferase
VIVVDDGLATGSTMIAALHGLRSRQPARLICAVPVAPAETLDRIHAYADEVVCLHTPENFYAVGQFYRDFPQVDDEEVIKALMPASPPALSTSAEGVPRKR